MQLVTHVFADPRIFGFERHSAIFQDERGYYAATSTTSRIDLSPDDLEPLFKLHVEISIQEGEVLFHLAPDILAMLAFKGAREHRVDPYYRVNFFAADAYHVTAYVAALTPLLQDHFDSLARQWVRGQDSMIVPMSRHLRSLGVIANTSIDHAVRRAWFLIKAGINEDSRRVYHVRRASPTFKDITEEVFEQLVHDYNTLLTKEEP